MNSVSCIVAVHDFIITKSFRCFALALDIIHYVRKSILKIMIHLSRTKFVHQGLYNIRVIQLIKELPDCLVNYLVNYLLNCPVNYLMNYPVNYLVQPHQEEVDL